MDADDGDAMDVDKCEDGDSQMVRNIFLMLDGALY